MNKKMRVNYKSMIEWITWRTNEWVNEEMNE